MLASSETKDQRGVFVRYYQPKNIAMFNRDLNDILNSSLSLTIGLATNWVEQLAGITNMGVVVASGSTIGGGKGVNEIVYTGVFSEAAKRIPRINSTHWTLGFSERFNPVLYGSTITNSSADLSTMLDNVQQMTLVDPIGAAAAGNIAIAKEYSLSEQLARLRKLPEGWDGEGAHQISQRTYETAGTIINGLFGISLTRSESPTVLLGPQPDGTLRFECTYGDKEVFLTVRDGVVEVQTWQPREAVESLGFWEMGPVAAMEHVEWLMK